MEVTKPPDVLCVSFGFAALISRRPECHGQLCREAGLVGMLLQSQLLGRVEWGGHWSPDHISKLKPTHIHQGTGTSLWTVVEETFKIFSLAYFNQTNEFDDDISIRVCPVLGYISPRPVLSPLSSVPLPSYSSQLWSFLYLKAPFLCSS